jgi:hypothetical protein
MVSAALLKEAERFRPIFRFKMGGAQSLEEILIAAKYDHPRCHITPEEFKATQDGDEFEGRVLMAFDLFGYGSPGSSVTTEEMLEGIQEIDTENPWLPGRLEHLLKYDAEHRQSDGYLPVVALGSPVYLSGHRHFSISYNSCPFWHLEPRMDPDRGTRYLWGRRTDFLVVRRIPVA